MLPLPARGIPARGTERARGRLPRALWILAGAGLLLRAPLFVQHLASPFARHLLLDAGGYWDWADRIAAGSLLPSSPFHQGPLYPYLLGAARAALPSLTPDGVAAAQLLMNWLSCLLFFPLLRRGAGERAALAAVAAALLFAPAAFFALKVLPPTISLLLFQFALLLLLREGAGWKQDAAAGGLLGLACLCSPAFLPAALAAALLLPCLGRSETRVVRTRTALSLAGPLLGLALVLTPAAAVNLRAGGGFSLSTNTGITFYQGNHPGAQGAYSAVAGVFPDIARQETDAAWMARAADGAPLTPGQVSRAYLGMGLSFMAGDPGGFLVLMGKKVLLLAGGQDVPLEHSLARERRDFLPWLWAFPLGGTAVLLLASATLGVLSALPRETRALAVLAAAFAASPLVFLVANRYALPFHFYLLPLAASAFMLPLRDLLRPAALGAAALVLAGVAWSWSGGRAERYEVDHMANLGTVLLKTGRLTEARDALQRVLAMRPGQAADWIALAELESRLGNPASCEVALLRARAADPASALPPLLLARHRIGEGRLAEASAFLDKAERANPLDPELAWHRVNLLLDTGKPEEAERAARRAREVIPSSPVPRFALGRTLYAQGRAREARDELLGALAIDPLFFYGLNDLAAVELALGDRDSARARMARARRHGLWVSPELQAKLGGDP